MNGRTKSSVTKCSGTGARPINQGRRKIKDVINAAIAAHKLGEEIKGSPTPCFNFAACRGTAVVSKQGKGVCRACAEKMPGVEYPFTPVPDGDLRRIEYSLNAAAAWPAV